jgi:hypothetical protein
MMGVAFPGPRVQSQLDHLLIKRQLLLPMAAKERNPTNSFGGTDGETLLFRTERKLEDGVVRQSVNGQSQTINRHRFVFLLLSMIDELLYRTLVFYSHCRKM